MSSRIRTKLSSSNRIGSVDGWLPLAGGGLVGRQWLSRAGLDAVHEGAMSLAFGLERCAMVHYSKGDHNESYVHASNQKDDAVRP